MTVCLVAERPVKVRKNAKNRDEPVENGYAKAIIKWKKRFSILHKIEVPTSWLQGKLSLKHIPAARPLNPAHVGVLRDSFNKTGTFNTNITLCFWGFEAKAVAEQLHIANSGLHINAECLDTWYGMCKEVGAIEGQHSYMALMELHERSPKKSVWKYSEPTIILCEGNPQDVEMVHAIGQQSNFKGTKFLKPEMCDLVRALHKSYMNHVDVTPGEVPPTVVSEIKQKWAHFNGVLHHSIGSYWNLAKHTGKIWDLIDLIIDGKVKKVRGRDFKIPKSLLHFNHMGPLPDDIIEGFLGQVTDGRWTLKDFYEQCNRYKTVMQLRRQVIEFMLEIHGVSPGCSWDQLIAKYPQITASFMEMWVPTMASVAKKARVLPDGLKVQLRAMTKVSEVQDRVKVGHLFNIKLCPMFDCFRARSRARVRLSSWVMRPRFISSTLMPLEWLGLFLLLRSVARFSGRLFNIILCM